MDPNDAILRQVRDDAQALLDEQIENLSERIYEVGRQADRQLTVWLTFTALTLLFALGMTESASVAGLQLRAELAATMTWLLSCVYHYRARLSSTALELWREALRERRSLRYDLLVQVARAQGNDTLEATHEDLRGFIPEFPGYLACSVLLKDEARRRGGGLGTLLKGLHYVPLMLFLFAPLALAIVLLGTTDFSATLLITLVLGLAFTFSGNALITFMAERERNAASPPATGDPEVRVAREGSPGSPGAPSSQALPDNLQEPIADIS